MKRSLFQAWEHWWLRQAPPHALALFRIGFGAFLLLVWTLKIPQVPMLFSDRGLILPLLPLPVPSFALALIIHTAFLACLLCFTLGTAMRAAGGIAFLINLFYWFLSLHLFNTSFDRLFLFLLLVLTLSGADRALSLRMRRERGSFFAWKPVSMLPQRIIALQITAVYLGVGFQKLWLPDWQSGDVLLHSLLGVWGSPLGFAFVRMGWPSGFYDAAVFLIKFFEVTIPFGLWIPELRRWFMLGGFLFHLGIALLLNIWWFLVLVPAYVIFLEPEDVRRWCEVSFSFDSRAEKNNG